MRRPVMSIALVFTVALGGCIAETPEPEERAVPAGPENGSFTASLNGFQIHYAVHGQGPVLMTVPNSWGLSLEGLRAMYRPLEERLTMVYFDPRGMGGSEAVREDADRGLAAVRADFQALREHLGLEKVNAIGWSNGAANLILLAHQRPETLSSAIFLHQGPRFTQEEGQQLAEAHPELMEVFGAFMQAIAAPGLSADEQNALHRKVYLEAYFPMLFADPAAAAEVLARVFGDAELSWPHAAYAQQEMPVFDATDLLSEIPVRSLVVAGTHDLLPPASVKPLHGGLPDSRWIEFENSGHFAAVEEPEAFSVAVFGFLGVGAAPTD